MGAADERLDPGGGGVQPAGAGGYRRPGAGGDGDGLRRFSGVHPVHLRPVRPHAAGLSGGGARPEPAAAGPGADFPPAAAVHGLCRLLGGLRLRHRRAAERASGQRVHPFCRPWTLAAWVLTLGIVLGSAWAYYELGWGGWWFWDPVENASFMPWLAGTALLHSLAVTEQRAGFKAWTLLLSICAFSLCLLGTFLVRSGVLVSVHAFASDPARGMFILAFMVLVTGGSLLLFAVRGHRVRSRVNNTLWSRESLLLGNNVLLMAAMLVVLLGTLLPLVHKQLGLGSISVGEPFFNTMFTWLMVPFALLLGVGPLVRWGRDRPRNIRTLLLTALVSTLVLSVLLPWLLEDKIIAMTAVGMAMACWIAVLAVAEAVQRVSARNLSATGNGGGASGW
ncbi:hypothetical protein EIC79_07020 [Salmonella enterica subsp. enterica serovar Derby]|nr:hypothetical protein EIC79_07020 [Salmonella enterica subsp. enterica serovar Derby]